MVVGYRMGREIHIRRVDRRNENTSVGQHNATRARALNNSFIQSFLSTLKLLFIRRTPFYPIPLAPLLIFTC